MFFTLRFLFCTVLVQLPTTSWHYSGFGTKLSLFFGFAKSSKYKTIFPLSLMPKSVVVAVMPSVFYLFQFSRFYFRLRFCTVLKSETILKFQLCQNLNNSKLQRLFLLMIAMFNIISVSYYKV